MTNFNKIKLNFYAKFRHNFLLTYRKFCANIGLITLNR